MLLKPPTLQSEASCKHVQIVERAVGEEVARSGLEASNRRRPDSNLIDEHHRSSHVRHRCGRSGTAFHMDFAVSGGGWRWRACSRKRSHHVSGGGSGSSRRTTQPSTSIDWPLWKRRPQAAHITIASPQSVQTRCASSSRYGCPVASRDSRPAHAFMIVMLPLGMDQRLPHFGPFLNSERVERDDDVAPRCTRRSVPKALGAWRAVPRAWRATRDPSSMRRRCSPARSRGARGARVR